MLPVVTPDQMRLIDESAEESLETLIERAAWEVAIEVRHMLGGTYGKRVWVLAGPGNNGSDGVEAARILSRWGVRCRLIDPTRSEPQAPGSEKPDLIVDAAFGTGLTRPYSAPAVPTVPVLAVDIPSGVNGLTGECLGSPLPADTTLTFGAYKPGLLFSDGPRLAGSVRLAPLGLNCSNTQTHLLTPDDLGSWPQRRRNAHKWNAAVRIVSGSAGMSGATALTAHASFAAGASYVGVFGEGGALPVEAVQEPRPPRWGAALVASSDRFGAVVVGPGMDPEAQNDQDQVLELLTIDRPLVLDGGALAHLNDLQPAVAERRSPTVITPHDGEFERLMGRRPAPSRIDETRELASRYGCVALLKGPTTCVADPSGEVRLVNAGDQRLATAGSGDVLSGIIAAGLAQGLSSMDSASLGALAHGMAGSLGPNSLTAGLLPALVTRCLTPCKN